MEKFQRTIQLIGIDKFDRLQKLTVVVLGVGGVGSFAVESLARSGLGSLVLIDKDVYEVTNINRQWPSTVETVGMSKVEVVAKECKKINPDIKIIAEKICLTALNIEEVVGKYLEDDIVVIDAIDDLKTKVILIRYLKKHNVKFISSMGAANIHNIDSIKYGYLEKTAYCPVAKILRKELANYKEIPVVYSTEERKSNLKEKGSIMTITAIFGLRLAHWVIIAVW